MEPMKDENLYLRSDQTRVSEWLTKRYLHEVLAEIMGPRFVDYHRRWDAALVNI